MATSNGTMPKVLVTDCDRGSAIAIIRSLGGKGYRVIAADSSHRSLGFRSRHAHEKVVYPTPEQHPDEFCNFMLETVASRGVDLIIPVTDLTIQPLSRVRHQFEQKIKLAIPENELLAQVTDKDRTVQLARKLGVPVPQTFTVNTAQEALQQAESLGWPVVLKPQMSRLLRDGEKIEKFSVTYAGGPEDLEEKMKELEGRCSVLLQRYLKGAGHGVELLMRDGQPIAAFQHLRLREVPITGGPSCYRESVKLHEDLYDYSVRILGELRWTGLAMVEFKVGDDRAELMEINGRVWGSLPLAVSSGVDFPALLTEVYLNGKDAIPTNLDSNYRVGLKCRDLGRDLMWMFSVLTRKQKYPFLELPHRWKAIPAFASLFNPRNKFDLFTISDPIPGLVDIPRIYQKFLTKRRNGTDDPED
ncbi:ATP-grasp domain-containing protein [bacterium]|nr:ATP-grasp domain-containing protein [bacterium]